MGARTMTMEEANKIAQARIAELEVQELGLIHSLRELLADNKRLKEAITEFLDTDPYYECTEKALRKLEEAGS